MKNAFLFVLSLLFIGGLEAKGFGRAEYAPVYLDIDMFQDGETIKGFHMVGSRAELSYVTENGWYARSAMIYARHPHCHFDSLSFSLGRALPVGEKIFVTPYTGIGYVHMDSIVPFDYPPVGVILVRDIFQGLAPHIGVEVTYNFKPSWRVSGSVQYAWTRDRTKIPHMKLPKRHSEGFAFATQIEYDINKNWSVNLGGGVNDSFEHDKNGTRIKGVKLGFVRWF